jgi:hypothetical protein
MWRRTAIFILSALLMPRVAAACPICFGAAHGPMLDAARHRRLVKLAITVGVLAVLAIFYRPIARGAQ